MRYVVTNRTFRVTASTIIAFMIFLEVGAFFSRNGTLVGSMIMSSALLLLMAVAIYRAARGATLIAGDHGVVVRGLARTRSFAWSEIDEFTMAVRAVGLYRRQVLGLRTRGGRTYWFEEINCGQRPASAARLRAHVTELNRLLAARHIPAAQLDGPSAERDCTKPGS